MEKRSAGIKPGIVARVGGPRLGARRAAERTANPGIELHYRIGTRVFARRGADVICLLSKT